jgi:hypothetical protein
MITCKKCLVELDDNVKHCPLCGTPTADDVTGESSADNVKFIKTKRLAPDERHLVRRILWQIIAILLFSGIIATLVIDLTTNQKITWSIYPVSICMIVFSYASLLAFWQTKLMYQMLAGWFLSTALLFIINNFSSTALWTIYIGIPILFAANLISIILIVVFKIVSVKGLNLLAYTFVAIAVLCISIEGIISRYFAGEIILRWSIIVAACLLPVTAALIFMFHRTRSNSTLQKIFHT